MVAVQSKSIGQYDRLGMVACGAGMHRRRYHNTKSDQGGKNAAQESQMCVTNRHQLFCIRAVYNVNSPKVCT